MYFKLFGILLFLVSFLQAQDKVVLQLKWFHQFQFAGYYAAKEKGYYAKEGLDVQIKQRDIKFNNIDQVLNGTAQYGVADSILLLYKAKKEPLVVISPIFQHSPSVFISLKKSGIDSPYKLDKEDTLFYPNDTDGFSLLAMAKKLDVTPNLIRNRHKDDYKLLLNEEVKVMPSYLSNEPFYFKKMGIPINVINPSNYGFDFYGDMLFTSEKELRDNPQRVNSFKKATLKGWEYALNHKEEIIQLIHEKYNKNKSIEHLRYEAKVVENLISKDTVALGSIDKGRFQYISNLYKEYGLIDKEIDLKGFIFEEYSDSLQSLGLNESEKNYLKSIDKIKVQNLSSFPPYNFYVNGMPQGYSIDYFKMLGKILGKEIEFISGISWKETLEMLKNGEIDVIPHIAVNKERKEFVTYTNIEHVVYQTSLGVRKGSNIKSFDDLSGKTLALLDKGFMHTIIKENYKDIKLYETNTIKDAVEAVANGKVDAVIDNLATSQYYINTNWLKNLETIKINENEIIPSETVLYVGVGKNNNSLKTILQKIDKKIPYNKKLELKQKWQFFSGLKSINFTDEEYSYLKDKGFLSMCIDPNWLPFEKIQNGEHIGMTSEYIKIFQEQLPIPINLVQTKDWLESLEFAKSRKCDFITIMMQTENRKKHFDFTKNLLNLSLVIATTKDKPFINDIFDVKDKTLAIVKGFAYAEILKEKYPQMNIIEVKNAYEGLSKVYEGSVYGFIGILPVIGYNIQQYFGTNLKIAGKLDSKVGFPIATRNDEPLLNNIFEKMIESIPSEKNSEILNKWLTIKYQEQIDYKTVSIVVLVLILILLIIVFKNRAINKINQELSRYIDIVDKHVITSTTDLDGNIISVSFAFCEISGYKKEELIGKSHSIVRHEDMPDDLYKQIWKDITNDKTWKGEIKNKKKDGDFYWVEASISPVFKNKTKVGYTAIRHDITDKKKIEEISITDGLTSLYNRRHFDEIFPKTLDSARREKVYFSFILMDIDHFKQYNDTYGHQKGDDVLIKVANCLNDKLKRANDMVFRLGGEEFGVLYKTDNKEKSIIYANTIREEIENLKIVHEKNSASNYVTVSMGLICDLVENLPALDKIYHDADLLLYKSKETGRNKLTS